MTTVNRAEILGQEIPDPPRAAGQRFAYDSLGETVANGGKALAKPLFSGSHAPTWEHCLNPLQRSVFRRWSVETRKTYSVAARARFPQIQIQPTPNLMAVTGERGNEKTRNNWRGQLDWGWV